MASTPIGSPRENWIEKERREFERVFKQVMPEADFTPNEQGAYNGEVNMIYLGWIARANKSIDDAMGVVTK